MVLFQRRQIDVLSVPGQAHAVATAIVRFFPKDFFGDEIKALQSVSGGNIEPLGPGVGANAFYVARLAVLIEAGERNAFDEFEVVVHVEDDYAVAAVLEKILDARLGDIEKMLFVFRRGKRKGKQRTGNQQ